MKIAVTDLNGDGPRDVAVATHGNNTVSVLLNTGWAVVAPSNLDFGSAIIGSTDGPQTITVTHAKTPDLMP
jgi:hypothetical protein